MPDEDGIRAPLLNTTPTRRACPLHEVRLDDRQRLPEDAAPVEGRAPRHRLLEARERLLVLEAKLGTVAGIEYERPVGGLINVGVVASDPPGAVPPIVVRLCHVYLTGSPNRRTERLSSPLCTRRNGSGGRPSMRAPHWTRSCSVAPHRRGYDPGAVGSRRSRLRSYSPPLRSRHYRCARTPAGEQRTVRLPPRRSSGRTSPRSRADDPRTDLADRSPSSVRRA